MTAIDGKRDGRGYQTGCILSAQRLPDTRLNVTLRRRFSNMVQPSAWPQSIQPLACFLSGTKLRLYWYSGIRRIESALLFSGVAFWQAQNTITSTPDGSALVTMRRNSINDIAKHTSWLPIVEQSTKHCQCHLLFDDWRVAVFDGEKRHSSELRPSKHRRVSLFPRVVHNCLYRQTAPISWRGQDARVSRVASMCGAQRVPVISIQFLDTGITSVHDPSGLCAHYKTKEGRITRALFRSMRVMGAATTCASRASKFVFCCSRFPLSACFVWLCF